MFTRLLTYSLLLPIAAAAAMSNEPAQFMGIEWGAPLADYRSGLRPIAEDGDSGHYRRDADRLAFAGIEVRRISYRFYHGKFSGGTVLSVGSRDLKTILDYLHERYGEPDTSNPRHRVYAWNGERTGIVVSCDISISCYTEFFDKALRELEAANQRNAARDAGGDDN